MAESITQFRLCGNEWRYCNGLCAQCPLTKIEYSTTTDTCTSEERGVQEWLLL